MKYFSIIVACFLTGLLSGHSAPEDPPGRTAEWLMFRGNQSLQGVSPEALPEKLKLLWEFKTEGPVRGSVVVKSGQAVLGSSDHHVYALDASTGKKRWSFKTGGQVEATPCLVGENVYVGSYDGNVYALDGATGELKWKYETEDRILAAANWARDSKTGKYRILVGGYDFSLHCLDAETGKAIWTFPTDNFINGAPALYKGHAVFGGCDGMLRMVNVAKGSQTRSVNIESYIAGSVMIEGDVAYLGHYDNEFIAVDMKEGKVLWNYRDLEFPYFSAAAPAKDMVVFGGRDKRVHAVNKKTGKVLWTFATRGSVDSSPLVAGDRVAVGSDDGRLYLLDLKTGKESWSYEIGKAIASSPSLVNGILYIGCDDGAVYAFGAK